MILNITSRGIVSKKGESKDTKLKDLLKGLPFLHFQPIIKTIKVVNKEHYEANDHR